MCVCVCDMAACFVSSNLRGIAVLNNTIIGTVARPVCEHLAKAVAETVKDFDDLDPIGEAVLEVFRPHGQPLAVADYTLRRALFDLYCANEDFESAATILSKAISIPAELQARSLVEIAQCYLLDEDAGSAEISLRKVAEIMGASEEELDKETMLRYRACRAQVSDLSRNYQQAAQMFSALSQLEGDVVSSELESFLERAATCAILDRAGPQRQRLLNKIYRDPRSERLPSYTMLEKMCRQRIVSTQEAEVFRSGLQKHHLASTTDGGTVFDRAVREHNILAASIVYTNVSFASLATLLGVDAAAAEVAAARMVEEGRLEASIDQLNGLVEFASGAADELVGWDASLMGLFGAVTEAVDAICAEHPAMAPA